MRQVNAEVWEATRVGWRDVPPERLFWGSFESLAKRSTQTVQAISRPATCDFGPCWPTRASCSYAYVCAQALRVRPR